MMMLQALPPLSPPAARMITGSAHPFPVKGCPRGQIEVRGCRVVLNDGTMLDLPHGGLIGPGGMVAVFFDPRASRYRAAAAPAADEFAEAALIFVRWIANRN